MNFTDFPRTHLKLIQALGYIEIEKLYLQSWILHAKRTALKNDPDFKKLLKRNMKNK